MISKSAALRALQRRPYVALNDEDAKELGVADGDEVVVAANGFESTLAASIEDIVPGAVFVPYDQQGLRANRLISGPDPTVTIRAAG